MKRQCENQPCTNEVEGRFKFCADCGIKRRRASTLKAYYKVKKPWEPFEKKCDNCPTMFTVKKSSATQQQYCDDCKKYSVKNWHKKPRTNPKPPVKSFNRRTKCKCPRCNGKHHKKVHLMPDERAKVDAGRPYRIYCDPCRARIERAGYCDVADAHGVGR